MARKRKTPSAGRVGSDFEAFLAEEGILEEVTAGALKEVFAEELRAAMIEQRVSEAELARRMGVTGRATVRRLLDPKNKSATIATMARAASAVGRQLEISLTPRTPSRRTRSSVARGTA